ncbi:hypothetical protein [Rhodococcus sp. PAMC28707]|uniref:hypothetical protein n=1 Tax=Rhodococcus sp. PAMC28707 TaxID=2565560 RepID=UPI001447578C|nr:hypothetical protein [Rhodococcus sp. PAMC28707]
MDGEHRIDGEGDGREQTSKLVCEFCPLTVPAYAHAHACAYDVSNLTPALQ